MTTNIHIVLYEPEIPPNTGNIIRLSANCGAQLHLIEPLGFDLDDKQCRRAGLDYQEWAEIKTYKNFSDYIDKNHPKHLYACTTKAKQSYTNPDYQNQNETHLLFGPETRGLPDNILNATADNYKIRIPMLPHSRSLNLSNAVAIITYHVWHSLAFAS